jgi:MerR family transcriptional regulator, light-induced transcriptional regulator
VTISSTTQYISTVQAAEALGVSVSTVKRWVDEGVLPAHRTAGGHRKLLRAEVLALARQGDLPRRDLAGLMLDGPKRRSLDLEALGEVFLAALLRGDAGEVRGVFRQAYGTGVSVEALADRVIAPVMQTIGHEWERDRIDVWREHRATQLCAAAIHDLLPELQARAERGRPIAIGGAPEADPYQLASLLAQLVLLDAGWEAVNLGPNTPFASFIKAMEELRPRLIWISASYLPDAAAFVAGYQEFYRAAAKAGVAVAVGGQALAEPIRSRMLYTAYGDGLSHLASLARTLHPRPNRPRRGRPRKNA